MSLWRRLRGDVEPAGVLRREQQRRREAEVIAELAKSLTQGLDLDAVSHRVADRLRELLGTLAGVVYRHEPATDDLVAVALAGPTGPILAVGSRLPRGAGIAGIAVLERRSVWTANVLEDSRLWIPDEVRAWIAETPHRAVLAVPLIVKDDIVGVVAAIDRAGREFSADDLRLAEALAGHAALALENARLYAEAERRRREAEKLAKVAAELTEQIDLASAGQRVVDTVLPLFQARAAGLRLVAPDGSLVGLAFAGLMKLKFDAGHVAPAGSTVSGLAVQEARAIATANAFTDTEVRLPDDVRDAMMAAGDGAVLAVPLRVRGSVIGALSVTDRPGRVFTRAEIELLQAFADQAAIALERARLHEQTELRRRDAEMAAARARLLAEASRVLTASLDLDTTLGGLTRILVPALADWSAVHLLEAAGAIRRVATTAADPGKAALLADIRSSTSRRLSADDGVLAQAIRSGRPLLVPDVTPEWLQSVIRDPEYLTIVQAVGPRSLMLVPLVARGRIVGTITLVRTAPPSYDDGDLAFAGDLGTRAGFAIDNARLFHQREQARLEAERANASKDEFLAMLSHELRTPLTSMLGWVRILRGGQLAPERVDGALEVIERNAHAQAQLINDLLDVSRIVAGKLQLDRFRIDLVPVIAQAMDSLAREAETKGVTFHRVLAVDSAHVLGDPTRLHQVLTNLLSNAIKFTPAGGEVVVTLDHGPGVARITVADTGAGVPPDLLQHIFDRFRQADSTMTRSHGGLGLGLAIVRHLVELHGGGVSASSAGIGKGASFTVELPLLTHAGPRAAPVDVVRRGQRLDGVRALVVEDDTDARDLVRHILEVRGAVVRTAASVAEALDRLGTECPNIVVTDLGMPDHDGYDLLRAIRAAGDDSARLPVIALTAYAGAEDRARALAAGFIAHLSKPIDPAVLVQAIGEIARPAAATGSSRP